MNELIAYILLPLFAFFLLVQFLDRAAAKDEAKARDREEDQRIMEEYEEERIRKLALLDLESEERARKQKAEAGRSKNPVLRSLGLRKIKK